MAHLPRKPGDPPRAAAYTLPIGDAVVPRCDCTLPLTFIGWVVPAAKPNEQWERYACRRCGAGYDYHRRTDTLQRSP